MNKILWIIASLFPTIFMGSCKPGVKALNSSDYTVMNQKDSMYLSYTVQQMIRERRSGFRGAFDSTYHEINRIVYSPDSSKFVSFLILRQFPLKELLETNEEYKPFYVGKAMIGYKDTGPEVWRIYPFDRFVFESYSKQEVIKGLTLQFFERLKSSTFPGSSNVYQYNVDEPAFWSGPFWQRQKGAYPFEQGLKGNKGINYPDTLNKY